jgi:hypothetical protein
MGAPPAEVPVRLAAAGLHNRRGVVADMPVLVHTAAVCWSGRRYSGCWPAVAGSADACTLLRRVMGEGPVFPVEVPMYAA